MRKTSTYIVQVKEDILDETICNLQQCQRVIGDDLPRDSARYSLTIRRVLKVKKLMKLPGQR